MPRKPKEPSQLEQAFITRWIQLGKGLPDYQREFKFHPKRKWAFDFAFPEKRVAVELEGGVFSRGRHTRGMGFIGDCDKYNAAVLMNWRVLRFTAHHLDNDPDTVFQIIRKALTGV